MDSRSISLDFDSIAASCGLTPRPEHRALSSPQLHPPRHPKASPAAQPNAGAHGLKSHESPRSHAELAANHHLSEPQRAKTPASTRPTSLTCSFCLSCRSLRCNQTAFSQHATVAFARRAAPAACTCPWRKRLRRSACSPCSALTARRSRQRWWPREARSQALRACERSAQRRCACW